MIEIAATVSLASSAFNAIKRCVETGREIEDIADYFGKWFEAKERLSEANQFAQNQPFVKQLFSGNSVEAQALEITMAKHKIKKMEKELYEYLLYSGQLEFYEDMMKERRKIREARIRDAMARAERKKFYIDMLAVVFGMAVTIGIIIGMITIIS